MINLSEQNHAGTPDGYSCMVRTIAVSAESPVLQIRQIQRPVPFLHH